MPERGGGGGPLGEGGGGEPREAGEGGWLFRFDSSLANAGLYVPLSLSVFAFLPSLLKSGSNFSSSFLVVA